MKSLQFLSFLLLSVSSLSAHEWCPNLAEGEPACEQVVEMDEVAYCPRCRAKEVRAWQRDKFLEKQYEESSWPSRRGDELSDQLSR